MERRSTPISHGRHTVSVLRICRRPHELTHTEQLRYECSQDAACQTGEEAVTSLKAALALAGLTLPSLSSDGPVGCRGFVRLGGCSTAVANQLAEVIAAGAHALQARYP
ncbi:hypothetical protein ABZ934_31415 [Streptomyces sp. NPDC046557]|uniref:hypothetical protein n=1 Tax=Streptomyces sp. NPDC046557 TaxID=3155372 RepID=UPI0033D84FBD